MITNISTGEVKCVVTDKHGSVAARGLLEAEHRIEIASGDYSIEPTVLKVPTASPVTFHMSERPERVLEAERVVAGRIKTAVEEAVAAERIRVDDAVRDATNTARRNERDAHDRGGLLLSMGLTIPVTAIRDDVSKESVRVIPSLHLFAGYHYRRFAIGMFETTGVSDLPGIGFMTGPAVRMSVGEKGRRAPCGILLQYGWRFRTGRSRREPDHPGLWAVGLDISLHPSPKRRDDVDRK